MKLRHKYHRMFERGMEEGAADYALGSNLSGRRVAVQCGYRQTREINAFAEGFTLGAKYVHEWREAKNLLGLAIKCGDVKPVDFEIHFCRNSLNISFELI